MNSKSEQLPATGLTSRNGVSKPARLRPAGIRRRAPCSRWLLAGAAATVLCAGASDGAQGRPAPSPSRYGYTLKIDARSLPAGVGLREVRDGQGQRYFISNTNDVPLVINERFQNNVLASGTKLVSGRVFQYFPSGVPMEGKTHLKGWQAPFGDIAETLLVLPTEPAKIYEGRKPGLSKELPPGEPVSIPAKYDERPYEIKGFIQYHLNEAYDVFYQTNGGGEKGSGR